MENFNKQLKKYATRVIKFAKKTLDMDSVIFDHICYQTVSKEDYHQALEELKDEIEIISEIPHAGRMLTIARLKQPVKVSDILIDRIEISEPKPKKTVTKRGFDHFSFTVSEDLEVIKDRLQSENIQISEVKQIGNSKLLKFRMDSIEIELRNNRLGGDEEQASADEQISGTLAEQLEVERAAKLRALADYQNLQRRIAQEKTRASTEGAAQLIGQLLGVIDDFDRAVENVTMEEKDQIGLHLVRDKLQQVVDSAGLEEISCEIGDALNPDVHEAVGIVGVDAEEKNNTIQQILQKGYRLKDSGNVARSCKVIVGKIQIQ